MIRINTVSDQLNTWSEIHAGTLDLSPAAAQGNLNWPVAKHGCGAARFADRALQTLRQAQLQMRQGARSWAQTLSFHQSQQRPSRDGLCTQGALRRGYSSLGALSSDPGHSRRTVRDQSRVIAPARGLLSRGGERGQHHACRPCARCRQFGDGQYGRCLAPSSGRCRWRRRAGDGG